MRNKTHLLLNLGPLLCCLACTQEPKSSVPVDEPYTAVEGAVGFDIKPVDNASQTWDATYSSGNRTVRFRIEFGEAKPGSADRYLVSSGSGKVLHEPDSDPKDFLAELAKALEAKKLPARVDKAATIPFDYVVLGQNQSRSRDGGFRSGP